MLKLKKNLATINFILCIVGYQLFQCLASPWGTVVSNSELFSWGYHILSLLYTGVVLFFFWKEEIIFNKCLLFVSFFFVMYFFRMIYDLELSNKDFNILYAWRLNQTTFSSLRLQIYIYIFFLTLFKFFVFAKHVSYIDINKSCFYIAVIGFLATLVSYFSNVSMFEYNSRFTGNITLGSIGYSLFLGVICLASIFSIKYHCIFFSLFLTFITVFSVRVMLLAASRGPLLALGLCLTLFSIRKVKKSVYFACFIIFLIFLLIVFYSSAVSFFENNYDYFILRLTRDNRSELLSMFFNRFFETPLFGFQLDLLGYSHNPVLDSFMMFGLFGGFIVPIILFHIFTILYYNKTNNKVLLLLLYFVVCAMFSGALSTNLSFWCLYYFASVSSPQSDSECPMPRTSLNRISQHVF